MPDLNLWIGFFVAVGLATGVVALLLWYQAQHRGVSPRRAWWAIVQIAASVVIALAAAVAMRASLGGEIVDLGRTTRVLGLWVRPLAGRQWLVLAAGLGVIVMCFVWALRCARHITGEAAREDHEDIRQS